ILSVTATRSLIKNIFNLLFKFIIFFYDLDNCFTTNSLDFLNKNPPIDSSKSPLSYEHFDPIADCIPRVVVKLFSQI
ncbi:hypothetical protein BDDG_13666, partial [Blastomyces dermatitidis ATCC 18188]